ncbi:MAG: NAD(P)H-dependent oxidoreductase subunit E [Verrucomicrobiota bacterium]|nr:NAD(P)H-dependent oxidoreductase subunit E [Verrucomicrobiota bacterium]
MGPLIPALQRIQHQFGYLKREALQQFSDESGVPLYRLHSVASFFPHFQLTPPKPVRLRICRDMACHMAGSGEMLRQLGATAGEQMAVEGVSCLGRCDRAPAACVAITGSEHEYYYHGRSANDLKRIAENWLRGEPQPPDSDVDQPCSAELWTADPYAGNTPSYAAVVRALAVRDEALDRATQRLSQQYGWSQDKLAQFRRGAVETRIDPSMAPDVAHAVRSWNTESDWAKGPELAGWSEGLLNELKEADLRGMGGAGIPATQKWKDVRDAVRTAFQHHSDTRAFIVVNGDESEPGTFKDRELLLRTPHLIVEGVILAGLLTEASEGIIFIRHEYPEQIEACRAEIARAEQLGVCGKNAALLGRSFVVSVFVSPGGYICGEQSALIEAMSDRRGEPRNMPPKLETNGLEDLPTLVSNVETYAWVPYIALQGGAAYAALGVNSWKGRRFFSVSGDVKRPGVYEVPMGMTLRELLYGEPYCQGIAGDRELKGFAPSGPSGGFLPAKLRAGAGLPRDHVNNKSWQALAARRGIDPNAAEIDILDLELELNLFRALSPTQALGAGVVVYAEGRDMAEQALNSLEFYRNESCGKCVPCRIGSQKMVSLGKNLLDGQITSGRWDNEIVPLITELGKAIEMASICGLGRSVPVPLRTAINYFGDDVKSHLSHGANGSKQWP